MNLIQIVSTLLAGMGAGVLLAAPDRQMMMVKRAFELAEMILAESKRRDGKQG